MRKFLFILMACLSLAGIGTGTFFVAKNITAENNQSQPKAAIIDPPVLQGYTVTFNPNGGTWSDGTTTTKSGSVLKVVLLGNTMMDAFKNIGSSIKNPPTRSGYYFMGWTTAADGTTYKAPSTAVTANTTVYAKWETSAVQVTMKAGDDGFSGFESVRSYYSSSASRELWYISTSGTKGSSGYSETFNFLTSNYGIRYTPSMKAGYAYVAVHEGYANYSSTAHNEFYSARSTTGTAETYKQAITSAKTFTLYSHKYFSRTRFMDQNDTAYSTGLSAHKVPQISWSWNTTATSGNVTYNAQNGSGETLGIYIGAWKSVETSRTSYGSRIQLRIYVPETTNISFTMYHQSESSWDICQISEMSTSSSVPTGFDTAYNSGTRTYGKAALSGVGSSVINYGSVSAGTYYIYVKFSTDGSTFKNASGLMLIPNFSFVYRGGYIGFTGSTSGTYGVNRYDYYSMYGEETKFYYREGQVVNGRVLKGYYTGSNGSGTKVTESMMHNSTSSYSVYAYMLSAVTVTYDANGGLNQNNSKTQTVTVGYGDTYGGYTIPTQTRLGFYREGFVMNYGSMTDGTWEAVHDTSGYTFDFFHDADLPTNTLFYRIGSYWEISFDVGSYYTFEPGRIGNGGTITERGFLIGAGRGNVAYLRKVKGGKMQWTSADESIGMTYTNVWLYVVVEGGDNTVTGTILRKYDSNMNPEYWDGSEWPYESIKSSYNHSIITYWKGATYTITFNSNFSGISNPSSESIAYNRSYLKEGRNLPTPSNPTGYVFKGWYTVGNGGGDVDGVHVQEKTLINTTSLGEDATWNHSSHTLQLYARFNRMKYVITLDRNSGSGGSGSALVTYGTTTIVDESSGGSLSAPTRSGYTFCGWTKTQNGTDTTINTSGSLVASGSSYVDSSGRWVNAGAVTLYAKWTANQYDLRYFYNSSATTYNNQIYWDTGIKIDWSKDFKFSTRFKVSTLGQRYLILGNYGGTNCLNVEIGTNNKIRLYMNDGGVDSSTSSAISANSWYDLSFNYTASTHAYSLTTGVGNITGTYTMSGTCSQTLLFGTRDHRGDATTFNDISLHYTYIYRQTKATFDSTYGTLDTPSRNDNWSFSSWQVYGGSNVSSSTIFRYTDTHSIVPTWTRTPKSVSVTIVKVAKESDSYTDGLSGTTVKITYTNTSGSSASTNQTGTTGSYTIWQGQNIKFDVTGKPAGYAWVGVNTSKTLPGGNAPTASTEYATSSSTSNFYIFLREITTPLYYSSDRGGYWYYEDGYFPQTYYGTSASGYSNSGTTITLGAGKTGTVYTKSGAISLVGISGAVAKTIKLNSGTSTTFNSSTTYYFKVEPIRWRVSAYGATQASRPKGGSGAVASNVKGVSDFLGYGYMNSTNGSYGTSVTGMNGWYISNSSVVNFNSTYGVGNITNKGYSTYSNATTTKVTHGTTSVSQSGNKLYTADDTDIAASTGASHSNGVIADKFYASDLTAVLSGYNYDSAMGWTSNLYDLGSGMTITQDGTFVPTFLDKNYGYIFVHYVTKATVLS